LQLKRAAIGEAHVRQHQVNGHDAGRGLLLLALDRLLVRDAATAPVFFPSIVPVVVYFPSINVNTDACEAYDISNNMITAAANLGQVGLEWQLGGFAADNSSRPARASVVQNLQPFFQRPMISMKLFRSVPQLHGMENDTVRLRYVLMKQAI